MNNYDVNSEIVGFNDDDDSYVSNSQCDSDIEFDLQIISSFIHFIVNQFWKTFNLMFYCLVLTLNIYIKFEMALLPN